MLFGEIELPGRPDLGNVRKLDLLPIPMIRRMQRLGMAVDRDYFHQLSFEFAAEMQALERDIASYIPPERLHEFTGRASTIEQEEGDSTINAASAEQIGKLLFEMLGVGIGKRLKTTKQGRISTDKKQLRDLELEHPVVGLVLEYRERAKLKSTYTEGLPAAGRFHPRGPCCPVCELPHRADTWRVHTEITTTRTETGRLSSKNPNLQNIPQRTELGAKVRAGFIASPGTKLVSVDLSQIELRVMAHLSKDPSMVQAYRDGKDIHSQTAMQCFGITDESKLDKISHRIPAKVSNFLCMYQGGGKALYAQLLMAFLILINERKLDKVPEWLSISWCDGFIVDWFAARAGVRQYLDNQAYRARRYGLVWDPFGRIRLVPEVRSCHSWIKEAGVRQAGNMPDQSMAAGIMKIIMAMVDELLLEMWDGGRGIWCWPLLPVHDQLILEVEEDYAETVKIATMERFDSAMRDVDNGEWRFEVPLGSDGEVLDRWKKG